MNALQHDLPGNIHEFGNVVERSMIISQGDRLHFGDWFM